MSLFEFLYKGFWIEIFLLMLAITAVLGVLGLLDAVVKLLRR